MSDFSFDFANPPGTVYKLAATAQEFSIPALDGDNDGAYFIRGIIFLNGTSSEYLWRPNGLSTNQRAGITSMDNSPAGGRQETDILIAEAATYTAPAQINIKCWVEAQRTVGGVAAYRTIETIASVYSDAVGALVYGFVTRGSWRDNSANLTSLVLRASAGAYLLAGSQLIVSPMAARFEAAA